MGDGCIGQMEDPGCKPHLSAPACSPIALLPAFLSGSLKVISMSLISQIPSKCLRCRPQSPSVSSQHLQKGRQEGDGVSPLPAKGHSALCCTLHHLLWPLWCDSRDLQDTDKAYPKMFSIPGLLCTSNSYQQSSELAFH